MLRGWQSWPEEEDRRSYVYVIRRNNTQRSADYGC
jgi:hypothetical protein